jgi:sugar lactone lactonase YvrE
MLPTRTPFLRAALIALLATCALIALHDPAVSQTRSERIRERLKTRPDDPTLWYYLAGAEFTEGDTAGGFQAMRQLDSLGRGFLPVKDLGFEPVWQQPDFREFRSRLEQKLPRVTEARELFKLDKSLIPEGIAYDPRTRSYFVGSIATKKIVRVDSTGRAADFSRSGELRQVLGLVVDAKRRQLHAVSTTLVEGTPDTASNRIVTYNLDAGALTRAVSVPAATQLNDVTVDAAGNLYTSDSGGGGVFRIRAGATVADTLIAPGTLPGVNGIAVATDGAALYLAHSTGVSRYAFATDSLIARIAIPKGETIAAIDGLYADGNTLIGVQNVTNPGRVIRIHLLPDGRGADRIETLLSHHHPAIDEPTTGTLVGRTFALLATTQVARFTPQGTITSPETVKPPVVMSISLDRK